MADLQRLTVQQAKHKRPLQTGQVLQNLLLTTLAVAVAQAPFSSHWNQPPQQKRQVVAQQPPNLLLSTLAVVSDIASGMPETQPAPRRPAVQTSTAFRNAVALDSPVAQAPFFSGQSLSPQLRRQNTSSTATGIPKTLTADAAIPFKVLPPILLDRRRFVLDTSRGVPLPIITFDPGDPLRQLNWPAPIDYRGNQQPTWDAQANPDTIPPAVIPPEPEPTVQVPAGRKRHRYIARYKGEDHEFATADALEAFVQRALKAEKPKPRRHQAPIRIRLTPEFREEVQEEPLTRTIGAKIRLARPIAALEQVRKLERAMAQVAEEDDDEVLLWLM